MATVNIESPRPTAEPELHLLLPKETEQPLWKSLFRNVDDLLFPKKLPPLVLTSRPVPVKDIWTSGDRKSTRLNSSHGYISYAVFCLKKKKRNITILRQLMNKKH